MRPEPQTRPRSAAPVFAHAVRAAALVLVVVIPLVIVPWGGEAYSRPKVLVLYALAVTILAGWLGFRGTSRRSQWTMTRPEPAIWVFILALLVSSASTVNPRLTFFGAPGRFEGLAAWLAYMTLFFAGAHFFGSMPGFRTLVTWTGVGAVAAIVYGVVQLYLPPLFSGEAVIMEWYGRLGVPRIPSTLGNPIAFGGYLAFALPLLLALTTGSRGAGRFMWLLMACLAVVDGALTLTRGAWLAILIGLGVLGLAAGGDAWRRHWVIPAGVGAAMVVAAGLLITVVGSPAQIGSRVSMSVETASGSLAQRLYIWDRTLGLIRARPMLGWGLETLREVFPYDRASLVAVFGLRPTIVDKAHNDLLQMAVSIGIPGAAAYAAAWTLVVVSALRLHRTTAPRTLAAGWLAAVVAYLVQVQLSFSTVALAPVVWLLAGAACGWEATGGASQMRGDA